LAQKLKAGGELEFDEEGVEEEEEVAKDV